MQETIISALTNANSLVDQAHDKATDPEVRYDLSLIRDEIEQAELEALAGDSAMGVDLVKDDEDGFYS